MGAAERGGGGATRGWGGAAPSCIRAVSRVSVSLLAAFWVVLPLARGFLLPSALRRAAVCRHPAALRRSCFLVK